MGWKQWILVAVVAIGSKSWLDSYLQPKLQGTVNGFCDPAFKRVEDEFRKNVESGFDQGAAIAVYHNGKRVVDLWGGYADVKAKRKWSEDTITMAFSVSKGLAAIVAALMVDRGLLDYDAPVTKYWPEFGQRDKGNITVKMLLSHQAGLVTLDTPVNLIDFINNRENVEKILAAQGTVWPAGSQFGYHTLTFGMYVDTLIQKIDPKRRSMGRIFQEDIASPHQIDFYLNTPKHLFHRAARIHFQSQWMELLEAMFAPRYRSLFQNMMFNPESFMARSVKAATFVPEKFNDPDYREAVMSSVTSTGTARGLAKLYGILATEGIDRNNNKRLLSKESITSLSTPISSGTDVVLQIPIAFGPGMLFKNSPEGSPTVFGHSGHGGQVGIADKKRKLGIGYVTNFISIYGYGDDPRYVKLEKAIYESVKVLDG